MVSIDDIDIFIMTHNRQDYIVDSIKSVLNSTVYINKITILDNESSDDTENIIKLLGDSRIHYIKTFGFLGNFYTARKIVEKKYVMLFHDDDILHPEYLEYVLVMLNTYENVSLVTSRYTEFFDNVPKFNKNISYDHYLFNTMEEWSRHMYYIENIAYATAVYRSQDFLSEDLEYEKFNKFNDWPFMAKMSRHGNVVLLDDCNLFFVRRHAGQDTWTFTNAPTIRQIVNWDKFYFNALSCEKDEYLKKNIIFAKKSRYFSYGKFNAFLPEKYRTDETKDKMTSLRRELFGNNISSLENKSSADIFLEEEKKYLLSRKITDAQYKRILHSLIKTKLEIIIVIPVFKIFLKTLLHDIFCEESPIKDCSFTIVGEKIDKKIKDNIYIHAKNDKIKFINSYRCDEIMNTINKKFIWIIQENNDFIFDYWNNVENALLFDAQVVLNNKNNNIIKKYISNYILYKNSIEKEKYINNINVFNALSCNRPIYICKKQVIKYINSKYIHIEKSDFELYIIFCRYMKIFLWKRSWIHFRKNEKHIDIIIFNTLKIRIWSSKWKLWQR